MTTPFWAIKQKSEVYTKTGRMIQGIFMLYHQKVVTRLRMHLNPCIAQLWLTSGLIIFTSSSVSLRFSMRPSCVWFLPWDGYRPCAFWWSRDRFGGLISGCSDARRFSNRFDCVRPPRFGRFRWLKSDIFYTCKFYHIHMYTKYIYMYDIYVYMVHMLV